MNRPDNPEHDDPNARAARALLRRVAQQPDAWESAREDALWRATQARLNASPSATQRRLQALLGIAGLSTAAALALALWVPSASPEADGPSVVGSTPQVADAKSVSSPPPLPSSLTFDSADRLRLPSGALAQRTQGTLVEVVTATANETLLRLSRGRVTSEVARLSTGQRYAVETASARVSVRGTRFAVAVDAPNHTVVEVEHGKVEVAPTDWRVVTFVLPGERRALTDCGGSVDASERSADPRCLAEAFAARAAASTDAVERDTLLLKGALAAAQVNATEAVAWWRHARELSPHGVHAEEVAFRELEALGQARQWTQRAERAQAFLRAFASSPRVSAVRAWVVPPR